MPQPNLSAPVSGLGPVPSDNQPGHHPDVEQDKPTIPRAGSRLPGTEHFAFRFEPLLFPLAAPFGVLPATTGLDLHDDEVGIRFGPWRMRFPRADVTGVEVTGPYHLLKVAGPPHLSLADRGVTFATNRQRGLCIQLSRPHRALDPLGLVRHRSVTVTVEAIDALADALSP